MVEEQSQQSQAPLAPALPYPMPTNKADMLDKIRPEEIVEVIRNRLMGKIINTSTNKWETNDNLKDNAISEIGAWDMSNLILSVANPNVSISKLNDKEIRRRAFNIMRTSIKMLLANWKQYKITNTAQISFIAEIVFSMAFITMKQCEGEGVRKMVMGTRQEMHQVSEYEVGKTKHGLFRRKNR